MNIYDWPRIPEGIDIIATDQDGYGYGYYKKPKINKDTEKWEAKERDIAYFMITPKSNPAVNYAKGWHWTRTLEERPNE